MAVRFLLGAIVLAGAVLAGCSIESIVLTLAEAPCYDEDFQRCRQPQLALSSDSSDACSGTGRRVCLVPIGLVSPSLIHHLVAHYEEQYGLRVSVLRPIEVPLAAYDGDRKQARSDDLLNYMVKSFPTSGADLDAILIGVTPVDIYSVQAEDWKFVFGSRGDFANPQGLVSTFRMNPETFGKASDDDVLFSRARKMVSKYVGLLYYCLGETPDPESPLYDSILSLDDLDRMQEPLPVPKSGERPASCPAV